MMKTLIALGFVATASAQSNCYTMGSDGVTKNYLENCPTTGGGGYVRSTSNVVAGSSRRCINQAGEDIACPTTNTATTTTVVQPTTTVVTTPVTPAAEVCNCDSDCAFRGDCCADYKSECTPQAKAALVAAQCYLHTQVSISMDFDRWCDGGDCSCDSNGMQFGPGGWCMVFDDCSCHTMEWGDANNTFKYYMKVQPNATYLGHFDVVSYLDHECTVEADSQSHTYNADNGACQTGKQTRMMVQAGNTCSTSAALENNPSDAYMCDSIGDCSNSALVHDEIVCNKLGLQHEKSTVVHAPCLEVEGNLYDSDDVMELRRACPETCQYYGADRWNAGAAPPADEEEETDSGEETVVTPAGTACGAVSGRACGSTAGCQWNIGSQMCESTSATSTTTTTTTGRESATTRATSTRGTTTTISNEEACRNLTPANCSAKADICEYTRGASQVNSGCHAKASTGRRLLGSRAEAEDEASEDTRPEETAEETAADVEVEDIVLCSEGLEALMTEENEHIMCGASTTVGMTCPAQRSYCDVRAGQDSAICCRKAAPEGTCKNRCGHLDRVNSAPATTTTGTTYVRSTGTTTGSTTRACSRYMLNTDGTKNCLN